MGASKVILRSKISPQNVDMWFGTNHSIVNIKIVGGIISFFLLIYEGSGLLVFKNIADFKRLFIAFSNVIAAIHSQ
jgi:hypothetical protein